MPIGIDRDAEVHRGRWWRTNGTLPTGSGSAVSLWLRSAIVLVPVAFFSRIEFSLVGAAILRLNTELGFGDAVAGSAQ